MCEELLGFQVLTNDKILVGQRILINQLLQHIANQLPGDATEIQIYQYARCYILALLGDTIFMDKLGDRVHLMFLEFLQNVRDSPQYSQGSACHKDKVDWWGDAIGLVLGMGKVPILVLEDRAPTWI